MLLEGCQTAVADVIVIRGGLVLVVIVPSASPTGYIGTFAEKGFVLGGALFDLSAGIMLGGHGALLEHGSGRRSP